MRNLGEEVEADAEELHFQSVVEQAIADHLRVHGEQIKDQGQFGHIFPILCFRESVEAQLGVGQENGHDNLRSEDDQDSEIKCCDL